jgi:hypothetical protein
MASALEVVRTQFGNARCFADIFGTLAGTERADKKRLLKKQYAILAKMTHPDRVGVAENVLANEVFAELASLYRRARIALDAGTYDVAFAHSHDVPHSVVITVGTATYRIDPKVFHQGDFSHLHLGVAENGDAIIAKIATDPTMNQYLVHEATVLARAQKDVSSKRIQPFMPQYIDSVILTESKNEQYRVNLFAYKPGYVSLTTVREAYPRGVALEDAAWIWRRVLGQAVAAQMLQTVHGAIVPDHVLVHPITHEPMHIGWAHAVERPVERSAHITTVIDCWRDWYPPEVFTREVPSHQTDLYMAGKTMVYLLGGDVARNQFPSHVPESIERLVRGCLSAKPELRPQSGSTLLREFTAVIEKLWGRRYRPLSLPNA